MQKLSYIIIKYLIMIGIILYSINCQKGKEKSMQQLKIHYHRYDDSYAGWTLWTWVKDSTYEIKAEGQDDFGLIFNIDLDQYPPHQQLHFLPKYKNWAAKDAPDRSWQKSMANEIWIIQEKSLIYTQKPDISPFIRNAFIDGNKELTVLISNAISRDELSDLNPIIELSKTDSEIKVNSLELFPADQDSSAVIKIKLPQPLDMTQLPGHLSLKGYQPGDLIIRHIRDAKKYTFKDSLGIFYDPRQTRFNIFAPGANQVTLNIYNRPQHDQAQQYQLKEQSPGLWTALVNGDLLGKYYTYQVSGPDPTYTHEVELIDPNARATTAHNGRGIIINDDTPIADSPTFPFEDAIIYELHIRDFTIAENSGVQNKGKYLGFVEPGTKLPGTDLATGLDHLSELGINTVQLLPVQDFEHEDVTNNYFWGYMPVNFNAPDGWYATNPLDKSAVVELKKLIHGLHQRGIKVVLDVVYNHTAETSPNIRYNFNGIAPNFYYRTRIDGSYWNGSGTGNEVRSETEMVRRFIVESVKYWVREYKVDGFRFDLMGLHDMETMRQIVTILRKLKPDIFIYGEPWTAGDTPIEPTVKGKQKNQGFAVFNDHFRDALKGPWFNLEPGYVQTGSRLDQVKTGIMGSITDFAAAPTEVINYVACHDGRTLWDRLIATTEDSLFHTDTELKAMDKLAAVILLTSQGTPFLHGGQEILRTKFGSHNSYNQPDKINKIRWDYKQENYDIFQYYQGLIKLRKAHPMFRLASAADIKENLVFFEAMGLPVPAKCIAYQLSRGDTEDEWRQVVVLINPNKSAQNFQIPSGKWILVINDHQAGTEIITPINGPEVTLKPISAMVMYQL